MSLPHAAFSLSSPTTAFKGSKRIAGGPLIDVALAVKAAMNSDPAASFLVFDDRTGGVVDLDLRGATAEIVARLVEREKAEAKKLAMKQTDGDVGAIGQARGRPKLGVVAREVTLLPRHWDWLALQSGGASQALRRLVEEARLGDGGRSRTRASQETAYRFMSAMAGDFAGFEEATRALFAGDSTRFAEHTRAWPRDIRVHAQSLRSPELASPREGG